MSFEMLAPGVHVWLQEPARWGWPNAGVVLEGDGATVIDTLAVANQAEPFARAIADLGFGVRRAVLTGDHLAYVGGTARFPLAGVYGSAAASAHLDQPVDVRIARRLYPELASAIDEALVEGELRTRTVSHVVTETTQLTPATVVVPVVGQSAGNLLVLVPEADLVFAGALCSFGVTPLAFDGDPAAWADTLDDLAQLASVVVAGHGPVGGPEQVAEQAAYLRACVAAEGDVARIGPGPWDGWVDRHWDEVNVERAALLAAGRNEIPTSLLRRVGLA